MRKVTGVVFDAASPDWQIKHLVENGVTFVFVDWYWSRGHHYHGHWPIAFGKAPPRVDGFQDYAPEDVGLGPYPRADDSLR